MVITKRALPRRTFIRGIGATLALPFLDAMAPALSGASKAAPRFAAIYCGNGANMFDWTPPTEGAGFTFSPILKPLEAFRDRTLVFTGLDNFPATDQGDSGGQHPRAAPAFMCRPARRSISSSPSRSLEMPSCHPSKSPSIATTSSAPVTTATPAPT
jgi:Protein of unknown function (DUF1552)